MNNTRIPFQLILFIFFFGSLALFINSKDTRDFIMYPMAIEALVERGTFYLDGSKIFGPTVAIWSDQFYYKDHIYLNKQPGFVFICGIVYFILYKLGITYKSNLFITQGMVTLFTSVILTAIMAVLIFNIAFKITKKRFYSFLISLFFAFGTLVFPYSGLTHHDIFATFFLLLGFYLLFYRYQIKKKESLVAVSLAGFCTGFALFNSYNTPVIMLVLIFYAISYKNLKDIILFSAFFIIGLLPSFVFNYFAYGDPLLFNTQLASKEIFQPYKYPSNIPAKIYLYLIDPKNSITFFSPITLFGILGITFLPKKYTIERRILFYVCFLELAYICTMEFTGGCQFGPRYLLVIFPFALAGLSGLFTRESLIRGEKYKHLIKVIYLTGIISIIICSTGSIMGCMFCEYENYAPLSYIQKIFSGNMPRFYFTNFGIICILIAMVLFLIKYPKYLLFGYKTSKISNTEKQ